MPAHCAVGSGGGVSTSLNKQVNAILQWKQQPSASWCSPGGAQAGKHAPLLRDRHKRALHILQHRVRAGVMLQQQLWQEGEAG